MKVVITEKPSVAKDIATVVGANNRKEGFYEGNGIQISWAFGHLIQLIDPEEYDDSLKKWDLKTLPIIPKTFKTKLVDDPGVQRQFNVIKMLINDEKTEEVICATDAGREGELIFRLIYEKAECNKPIKRLWISSQTDQAIKEGFESLAEGQKYNPLYHSALSRAEADWLIGMNATRGYTVRCSQGAGVMSVGRVQTPVLKMIVDRYRENKNFESKPFYEISGRFIHQNGDYQGKWFSKDKETRFFNKADAEALLEKINASNQGEIKSLTKKTKKEQPPLLYDLTELQKDANKRYKFSADETLKLTQSLYEKHKVLTYPRTSSRYLSKDIAPKLPERLANLAETPEYETLASDIKTNNLKLSSRLINDQKVTDHHAIIPTEKKPVISEFTRDEARIYDLVIKRFLAAYLGDCVKDSTEIITTLNNETFKTIGIIIKEQGWRKAYLSEDASKDENDENVLPDMAKKDPVETRDVNLQEGKTKAPPLYTEASILAAMETAGHQCDDEELREAMKECGLGTPATRASILERLLKVGYVSREKNKFTALPKGEFLIDSIQNGELLSAELTGNWEKKLNDMAQGRYSRGTYMEEIQEFAEKIVEDVSSMEVKGAPLPEGTTSYGACPKCEDGFVIDSPKSYSCHQWRHTQCDFTVWKEINGKQISAKLLKELLSEGKTQKVIKGFTSRGGKKFDAFLKLTDGKVGFEFENSFSSESLGKCPVCEDGEVVESPKAYSCNKWRDTGCKFAIWKQIASRPITQEEAKILLEEGKTERLTGFKSKAGKEFECILMLNKNKVEFQF